MLTALIIKNQIERFWLKKLLNKIKKNKIVTEVRTNGEIFVKYVTYINRTGDINWKKLNAVIGNQRNHLLCSEEINFPTNSGFRRFENLEYKGRLSSNLFLEILSRLDIKDLQVGLYDPDGEYTDILSYIVKYVANPVVVTDNMAAFNWEIDNIYEEYGATIQLTNNRENLGKCCFILAPAEVKEVLPFAENCVILSAKNANLGKNIFEDYHIRIPEDYKTFREEGFTDEYLCGWLYTKGRQFELGSIVPYSCSGLNDSQTIDSLCEKIRDNYNRYQIKIQ